MKKIIIVPTSHIAEQSIRRIKEVVEKEKPDCIAVELDAIRYKAMKEEQKGSSITAIKNMGFATYLIFFLLKYIQKKLGGMVGIMPGADMLSAVDSARENNINVAFIDLDIRVTAYKFKTDLPLREKMRMIKYVLATSFTITVGKHIPFRKTDKSIDLRKVPEKDFIKEAMKIFREQFPHLYRILLDDRNDFMAKNILSLITKFDTLVVVIGAGHEEGIKEILTEKMNNIPSH
ncbi:MAG: TraB/GumN family protein [Candidatus Aenigmarchaeota archaeon]|nr:TraB/GumN family protein [Candidatus Aenigmarchaeota archaeon]